MIHFRRESLMDMLDEALPMMISHNEEIDLFGEKLKLNVEGYRVLEENGNLAYYTARDDDKLIGYACFMIYPHMHHIDMKVAHQDAIYIDPKYRVSGIGLLRYTEKELKNLGVNIIMHSAPVISRIGGVLKRLGYKEMETIYTRKL